MHSYTALFPPICNVQYHDPTHVCDAPDHNVVVMGRLRSVVVKFLGWWQECVSSPFFSKRKHKGL